MRSWKTSLFAILGVGSYVAGHFLPQHKDLFDGLSTLLLGGGLVTAKDFNVTGAANGGLLGKYGHKHRADSNQAVNKEPGNEGAAQESPSKGTGPDQHPIP